MARTKKARLVVLLEPETFRVVEAMAHAGGLSMSGFVSSLVEGARPQMEQIAAALEVAKTNQFESLERMSRTLAGMLHEGTGLAVELHKEREQVHRTQSAKSGRKPRPK